VDSFRGYANLDSMLASPAGAGAKRGVDSGTSIAGRRRPRRFTPEIAEWKDAIDHPDVGDKGAAIFDGIAYGLELLRKRPVGNRRAILLISQEPDDGSKTSMKDCSARVRRDQHCDLQCYVFRRRRRR